GTPGGRIQDAGGARHGCPRPRLPVLMSRVDRSDVINIADLRRLARARAPRVVFDYIDGGADDEVTLRENERVYDDVTFRPRSAVVTPACDLTTSVLGTKLALPFILAPIGSTRLMYARGE